MYGDWIPSDKEFQSTLSVRRATLGGSAVMVNRLFQSTLSVRRATRRGTRSKRPVLISIHALREESDSSPLKIRAVPMPLISIHALREESDSARR